MILPVTLVGGPLDGQELLYAEPFPHSIVAIGPFNTATYFRRRNTMFYDAATTRASSATRTPSKGTPDSGAET